MVTTGECIGMKRGLDKNSVIDEFVQMARQSYSKMTLIDLLKEENKLQYVIYKQGKMHQFDKALYAELNAFINRQII